jgi:hypothetical protein
VLTITYRDIQSEDGATQILFWKNLKFVMSKNGVPNVNFKGIMTNSAQTNCNAVKMIYGDGNSCLLMVAREHTCIFHWSVSLDR